jgi:hypothetical protein
MDHILAYISDFDVNLFQVKCIVAKLIALWTSYCTESEIFKMVAE